MSVTITLSSLDYDKSQLTSYVDSEVRRQWSNLPGLWNVPDYSRIPVNLTIACSGTISWQINAILEASRDTLRGLWLEETRRREQREEERRSQLLEERKRKEEEEDRARKQRAEEVKRKEAEAAKQLKDEFDQKVKAEEERMKSESEKREEIRQLEKEKVLKENDQVKKLLTHKFQAIAALVEEQKDEEEIVKSLQDLNKLTCDLPKLQIRSE